MALATFAALALGSPGEVLAYRPFGSTDADVAAADEIELELGYLTIERDAGETAYITPSVIFNYGLTDTLELVGEFELEKPADGSWEVADPGLFLKWLVAEGALQDQPGVSVAIEAGALLPLSDDNENNLGAEAILIASTQLAPLTYHLNLGGGLDRSGEEFWLWGVIGEAPVSRTLTLAAEVEGEEPRAGEPVRTALLGARFEPDGSPVVFDIGVRRGLTGGAPDWSLTLGLTAAF